MAVTRAVDLGAAVAQLERALDAHDLEAADRLFLTFPRPLPTELLRLSARLHLERRRWRNAIRLFEGLPEDDPERAFDLNLARNLEALEKRHVRAYQELIRAAPVTRYRPVAGKRNHRTIEFDGGDGLGIPLSENRDPEGTIERLRPFLDGAYRRGDALAFCGIGDGIFLDWVARNPPQLFLDQEQPIYVIEPDPELVRECLRIRDYSGSDGAIAQERIRWFIGATWQEEFCRALLEDLYLPFPAHCISQGVNRAVLALIDRTLEETGREMTERTRRWMEESRVYYEGAAARELAALFGPHPPRQPRALFLTTRFTTVLQYNIKDAAAGFRELGWDARVLMEPSSHHRMNLGAIFQSLAEWKPDLIFQIDHLRYEHGDSFPPEIPFVCWIQDHLENLTNPRAGASITPRDFVLTLAGSVYSKKYGYPTRQFVSMNKLTRVVEKPLCRSATRDDVVYVSHNSKAPNEIAAEILRAYRERPELETIVAELCHRMIAEYDRGGSLATSIQVLELLQAILGEQGRDVPPALKDEILVRPELFFRLNSALYRQQVLGWAKRLGEERGLSLALYGKGWEGHPEFASFARGCVGYGPDLERVTRAARFNLQVVPYFALHHRLLDGLVAGGFFLIRKHPHDSIYPELNDFASKHLDDDVSTLADAMRSLDSRPELSAKLESLVRRYNRVVDVSDEDDPIEVIRNFQSAAQVDPVDGILPRFDEVCFASYESLERCVERFADDADLRQEIVEAQRQSVARRLSYRAGMERFVRCAAELLASEGR